MKATFELAWKYLNSCTYFAKPYYNTDGSFISFNNEFQDSLNIDVDQNYVYLECGCWSLDAKTWFSDYTLHIKEKTFEEAIVALYKIVYERCGKDYTDDYFHIDDIKNIKECMVKNDSGSYTFISGKTMSYWDYEKLLEKIKSFA